MSLANTIHHSAFIYNHLMSILISIFISGYHGKTTDFAKNNSCHRTTIAHFLNSGKWDDSLLSDICISPIEIFFASVRINWHWTATRYVLRRGSEDIDCSCQWHILCAWQGLVNSVPSKKATTELEALSRQKSISISSNTQKKVMILMHL